MKREKIIHQLQQVKTQFFSKYPLKSMALFGSFARNEADKNSDIDILVEFSRPTDFEIVDLTMDLENIFHKKVDIISRKGVKPNLLPFIEKDLIYV